MGASGGIGPVGGTAAAAGRYNGHAMLPQQLHYPGRQGHLALAEHAIWVHCQDACRPRIGQNGNLSGGAFGRNIGKRQIKNHAVSQPGAVLRTSRRRDGW